MKNKFKTAFVIAVIVTLAACKPQTSETASDSTVLSDSAAVATPSVDTTASQTEGDTTAQ